jgi:tetratricopeptide (TPR) repeat protein
MLETIREFAVERLAESGEAEEVLRRLALDLLVLGESARLMAEDEPPERPELVRPELDNFRRAIEWAREHDPELAFRLAISLEMFWVMNDAFEGTRVFEGLLEGDAEVAPVLRARALRVLSEAIWTAGEVEAGARFTQESLAAFERLGDERGVAIARHRLGVSALTAGDLSRARELLEASLATCRRHPDLKLEGDATLRLADVERREGDIERALELFERSILLLRQGDHNWILVNALQNSAELLHELGDARRADERARESLRLAHELVDRQSVAFSLTLLAQLATASGGVERAGCLWGAVEAEAERAPIGLWERGRDRHAAQIVRDDPAFERGRAEGHRLSLDDAVEYALGP